jgi:hypothetical protein
MPSANETRPLGAAGANSSCVTADRPITKANGPGAQVQTTALSLEGIARRLGDDVVGVSILCPGPNRPPEDRSLLVTPTWVLLVNGEGVSEVAADGSDPKAANKRDAATAERLGLIKVVP